MPRLLLEADAALLAALHQSALPNAWDADAFEALLAQPTVFGFIENEIGFILMRSVLDEAEILTFTVQPDHQHQGIGTMLLKAGLNEAHMRGAHRFFLEVEENNAAAINLYKRSDFVPISRRENYYKNGATCIVMEKNITT